MKLMKLFWSEFAPSACFDEISQVLMIPTNQRPFFNVKVSRFAECNMSHENTALEERAIRVEIGGPFGGHCIVSL